MVPALQALSVCPRETCRCHRCRCRRRSPHCWLRLGEGNRHLRRGCRCHPLPVKSRETSRSSVPPPPQGLVSPFSLVCHSTSHQPGRLLLGRSSKPHPIETRTLKERAGPGDLS